MTVISELGTSQARPESETFTHKKGEDLEVAGRTNLGREEGRMWVFIRPRGGQEHYLLTCEIRGYLEFCPIHRFDRMDQILLHFNQFPGACTPPLFFRSSIALTDPA